MVEITNYILSSNPAKVKWINVLWIVIALFFVIACLFGFIYYIMRTVMEKQGRKIDSMMYNVVVSNLITDSKGFKKLAKYKNKVYFVKTTFIPIIILLVAALLYFIFVLASKEKDWGFIYKYTEEFFPKLVAGEEDKIIADLGWLTIRLPHFDTSNVKWVGFDSAYLAARHYVTLFWWLIALTGFIYYFVEVQGYFARALRIRKISKEGFSKNLINILQTSYNPNPNPNIVPNQY